MCRTQAKSKSTQLQEAIAAAINDRDELQKKYEAKSRYAPRCWQRRSFVNAHINSSA